MDIQLYPALWVTSEWNFSTSTWVSILFYPFLSFSILFYPFLSSNSLVFEWSSYTLYQIHWRKYHLHFEWPWLIGFVTDSSQISAGKPPGLTMGGRCKGFGLPDQMYPDVRYEDKLWLKVFWLVVNLPLWKMMEWKSVGIMKFPIYGKTKFMFQTTNQFLKSLKISDSLTIKKALKLIRSGNSAVRRVSTAVSPRALSQTKVQLGPILNPSGLSANCHWNSLEFPGIHWSSREFHGYWRLLYQIFSGSFHQFQIPWSTAAELIAARISSSLLPQSISKLD